MGEWENGRMGEGKKERKKERKNFEATIGRAKTHMHKKELIIMLA
jgi:hypothetical protein